MSQSRIAAVQAGFLLMAMWASAAVNNKIWIKVLDSETHSVVLGDGSGVPKNCDGVNFDADRHNSKAVQLTNTMLVQEDDQSPFRISCSVDTRWSRCTPLPSGESFDARREKRGLLVYFADDNGKMRKQLYSLVATEAASAVPSTAPNAAPVSPAPRAVESGTQAATPVPPVPPVPPAMESSRSVKCSFTSTPSGAEVTVDGRYTGSTPSVLTLSTGVHVVVVSSPGFAQWKRELTVSPESDLTINAILKKRALRGA